MIDRKLITKFFDNRCTADEAAAVVEYFNKHPKKLEYYLPEKEWEQFKANSRLPKEVSERIFRNVKKETHQQSFREKYLVLSIAASVVFCLLVGLVFWKINTGEIFTTSRTTQKLATENNAADFTTIINHKKEKKLITLEEGSVIELSGGSSIRYPGSFKNSGNRPVYLKGEAFFTVTKNPDKPFVVYAGGLSTTALGTSFSVYTDSTDREIRINLYTGKVVVKAVSEKMKGKLEDIYLTPGYGLQLDPVSLTSSIHKLSIPVKDEPSQEEETGRVTINGNTVEFKGMPLPAVFDTLSGIYKTKITYASGKFSKTYFTGEINKTNPLENTLNTLAILNNLKVIKDPKGYRITNGEE